jgi:tetratricopeptide (TPR) repeat protein
VLKQEHQQTAELVAALSALHAPPETPDEVGRVVVEAMRQNLLFARRWSLLTSTQDRLLRAASLYRVPVNEDGLLALTDQPAQAAGDWQRLATYFLLEWGHDPELALDYWLVPPVVRELLHDHDFSPSELQALHRAMGRYHRFQGQYISRRWSDGVEAIYHFRQAGEHTAADEMAKEVSAFYYLISNYTEARALTEEIVQRVSPSPPWWALNRYGMCQFVLGLYNSAVAAFERALPITPTQVDKGSTLNNLSQLSMARGDYGTAQRYLEASLAICREIGDKAGEGRALHNMGFVAWETKNTERATTLWAEALDIGMEIRNAERIFYTASTLGQVLAVGEAASEARPFLQLAVEVGKATGFPKVQEVEAVLRRLPSAGG